MRTSCVDVGIATRAMPGDSEQPCGDVGFFCRDGATVLVGLIDGLGHGPKANDVAERARNAVTFRLSNEPLEKIFEQLTELFRADRGFVAAICRVNPQAETLEFSGIGNITSRLFRDGETTLLSGSGIVGQYSQRPKSKTISFPQGSFLVLHTDGLSSHLHARQLLEHRHESADQAAHALLEQHARSTDDCGVVVIRCGQ
mgnify:CR=1 FL=1